MTQNRAKRRCKVPPVGSSGGVSVGDSSPTGGRGAVGGSRGEPGFLVVVPRPGWGPPPVSLFLSLAWYYCSYVTSSLVSVFFILFGGRSLLQLCWLLVSRDMTLFYSICKRVNPCLVVVFLVYVYTTCAIIFFVLRVMTRVQYFGSCRQVHSLWVRRKRANRGKAVTAKTLVTKWCSQPPRAALFLRVKLWGARGSRLSHLLKTESTS